MEVWKDIKEFEGLYQISNQGRVKSLPRLVPFKHGLYRMTKEKILKNRINGAGYGSVFLCKPNVQKQVLVHRLVAEAFVPNPLGLKIVNHKDEDPLNCNFENLEWCTHKYNLNYGTCPERLRKYAKAHPSPKDPLTGRFKTMRKQS